MIWMPELNAPLADFPLILNWGVLLTHKERRLAEGSIYIETLQNYYWGEIQLVQMPDPAPKTE